MAKQTLKLKRIKNKNFRLGSIITGGGLGSLIGYWLNLVFSNGLSFGNQSIIFVVCGALLGLILGFILPKTTEITAYAVSVFVMLQYGWDVAFESSIGNRTPLFWVSLVLLLINMVTGHFGVKKGITTFFNALGLSFGKGDKTKRTKKGKKK